MKAQTRRGREANLLVLHVVLYTLTVLLQVCPLCVSTEQTVNGQRPSAAVADDDDDRDLLVVEDSDDDLSVQERDVFVATKEWQVVKEGQSIPPGLHVRMNLQTGLKEAKLLDDDSDNVESENKEASTGEYVDQDSEDTPSDSPPPSGTKFMGDNRRTHYFGKSDRRGIVNKKTKVFSRRELMEALNQEESNDGEEHMLLTAQESQDKDVNIQAPSHEASSKGPKVSITEESSSGRQSELPYIPHEDVERMVEHSQTLARKEATVPELVHALKELEYHVHNLDNAKDLNAIGGLVLVIRQLNHSSPEVRSHAAHVIGAASQRQVAGNKLLFIITTLVQQIGPP